jgi:hypothetical protein
MMLTAAAENSRTLAAALGIGEEHATRLLDIDVAITAKDRNIVTCQLATELSQLLQRTVRSVILTSQQTAKPTVEVVIGEISPVTRAATVWVDLTASRLTISRTPVWHGMREDIHPSLILLSACYAAGAALQTALGKEFPFPFSDPLIVDFSDLFGPDLSWLSDPIELGECYLAGAGAVGNGFLWALRHLQGRGILYIADPDIISDGNLNRCVWFTDTDVGASKADRLAALAQPYFSSLRLVPHAVALRDVPAAKQGGAWLKRLIVGVDSRRARRNLQLEIPGEVFDASTTGIVEIVLHHHRAPTDTACLSCIYVQEEGELSHERHVAEALGVSLDDVKLLYVSPQAAGKITLRYPQLQSHDLIGLAYDSLFKQLCGQGALQIAADRQVLAPFGFVSVLAGTYLALECAYRLHHRHNELRFNYWRASPWCAPTLQLRVQRPKHERCEFCQQDLLQQVTRQLWQMAGESGHASAMATRPRYAMTGSEEGQDRYKHTG